MPTSREICPVNRSTLPQTRQRHEGYPTTPLTDTSRLRPHPANEISSLAQDMGNFGPHVNPVQRQFDPSTDLWSGNIGLTSTHPFNSSGYNVGMDYYNLGAIPVELPSSVALPNSIQPNGVGSSRSSRREAADISLRRDRNQRPFMCEWRNCPNNTGFERVECLRRHVLTQHVDRGSFKCYYAHCNSTFNRKDNLRSHVHMVHISHQ